MATATSYLSVDRKGRATLPEDVRASLGLRPGDFVLLERTERGTYDWCRPRSFPVTSSGFTIRRCSAALAKRKRILRRGELT